MDRETSTLYNEAQRVRKAIRIYGGSFMQALGNAMDYADVYNLAKIRDTWRSDWDRYLDMYDRYEARIGDGEDE